MANAALLLDDDGDEENTKLLEFYDGNLSFLMNTPLYNIDPSELRMIAVKLHSGPRFGEEWREYAYSFGIENNYELDKIQQTASSIKDIPLYVTLIRVSERGGSIGLVIKTLCDKQRLDILKELQPYIETMLENKSTTKVKRLVSVETQHSTTEKDCTAETAGDLSRLSIRSYNSDKHDFFYKCDTSNDADTRKCKFDSLVKFSSTNSHGTIGIQSEQLSETKEIILNNRPLPSAPLQELSRVFIMHTNHETSIAEQLSAMLKEERIDVKTLSDIEPFIMMDAIGALSSIFQEVDFIVPIVSSEFLHQIHPRDYAKYIESTDAKNNRCLYKLFMNEYITNRCLNLRVRPMLVPDFDRNLIIYDLILSSSLRLWTEVPKLIKVLHKTKELLENFTNH